jgi:hypothetical protein
MVEATSKMLGPAQSVVVETLNRQGELFKPVLNTPSVASRMLSPAGSVPLAMAALADDDPPRDRPPPLREVRKSLSRPEKESAGFPPPSIRIKPDASTLNLQQVYEVAQWFNADPERLPCACFKSTPRGKAYVVRVRSILDIPNTILAQRTAKPEPVLVLECRTCFKRANYGEWPALSILRVIKAKA